MNFPRSFSPFAALALAVGAIIILKVTNKANSIPTDAAN